MKHDDSRARRVKMGEQMAEWGRQWTLETDMIRCPFCHSVQTATHADRSFVHDPGCRGAGLGDQYPWRALAWILREL
ncbi:hypothetical protein [Pseudomonas sp. KNUC1026]|uniref:hypothetical protein n=1 Tax=Pseudomonas sp. KNUC1026 TaxID=2893890 RepID=UPI001F48D511|nr:hypothetical protein [Pseudomonas sp. KNUC1026]UFH51471.1 hypothetical protein LN139_11085 [Pseudomonas sp. KNUC1026]